VSDHHHPIKQALLVEEVTSILRIASNKKECLMVKAIKKNNLISKKIDIVTKKLRSMNQLICIYKSNQILLEQAFYLK